jgi:hypothetical protein
VIEDLDLDDYDLKVTPTETPEDAAHRRWLDKARFLVLLGLFVGATGLFTWMSFWGATPNARLYAQDGLKILVGALAGWLVGKKS